MGYVRVVKRRYPLEALARVRSHETRARARKKGVATAERLQAERRVGHAIEEREREQGRLRAERDSEAARLDQNTSRAVDLVQGDRYRSAAERRLREREEAVQRARGAATRAHDDERAATLELAKSHEAEKKLGEHESRFRLRERRAAEQREADARDDFSGHRGRGERKK